MRARSHRISRPSIASPKNVAAAGVTTKGSPLPVSSSWNGLLQAALSPQLDAKGSAPGAAEDDVVSGP